MKKILLGAILLAGAFYRFYNLNWDEGHWFHPDERNVAMAVGRIEFFNQLDPQFFAYNGFWIYLTRILADGISLITNESAWLSDWGRLNLITRFLSAGFSTASIYLVFKIARQLMGTKPALLAAALSAYTVGFLQYAHYGVTESLLVFWVLLIIQLTFHRRWVWLSVVCGLAIATKTSAISFLIIPGVAWLQAMFDREQRRSLLLLTPVLGLLLAATCFLATPYSFLSWEKFSQSMTYEGGVVSGELQVPYTLQFAQTKPYLFSLGNLAWHLGPLLAIFGLLGVVVWLVDQIIDRKASPFLPALVFAAAYFGYVGQWYTKFIRYLLPIYPVLIIAAVWALLLVHRRFKSAGLLLIFGVLATTFLWATAYMTIFDRESTRLTASRWIFENISSDSRLLTEHWDDRLPVPLSGYASNYDFVEMTNYEPDLPEKLTLLSEQLAEGDYVILSSRRLWGSIGRNPLRYPLTSAYYRALFAEELGYNLIERFDSYPQLGPWVIDDELAEETFQVYDHPTVFIFQNQARLTSDELKTILQANENQQF